MHYPNPNPNPNPRFEAATRFQLFIRVQRTFSTSNDLHGTSLSAQHRSDQQIRDPKAVVVFVRGNALFGRKKTGGLIPVKLGHPRPIPTSWSLAGACLSATSWLPAHLPMVEKCQVEMSDMCDAGAGACSGKEREVKAKTNVTFPFLQLPRNHYIRSETLVKQEQWER